MSRKGKTDFVSLIQAARAGQSSTSELEDSRTDKLENFSTTEVEKLRTSRVHSTESSEVANLKTREVQKSPSSELEDLRAREIEKPARSEVEDLSTREAENFSRSELENLGSVHFSQLESKTVRFRDEQLERVAQVAKRLRRAQKLKARESGRITDNTLIRVAVDFMLAHAHKLVGETEPELLESLHKQTEEGRPV